MQLLAALLPAVLTTASIFLQIENEQLIHLPSVRLQLLFYLFILEKKDICFIGAVLQCWERTQAKIVGWLNWCVSFHFVVFLYIHLIITDFIHLLKTHLHSCQFMSQEQGSDRFFEGFVQVKQLDIRVYQCSGSIQFFKTIAFQCLCASFCFYLR